MIIQNILISESISSLWRKSRDMDLLEDQEEPKRIESLKDVKDMLNALVMKKTPLLSKSYTTNQDIVSCDLDELLQVCYVNKESFKTYRRGNDWKCLELKHEIKISAYQPSRISMENKKVKVY